MSSTETLSPDKPSDIYHDIYDFSLFPISLGDILTWGVKSALRAKSAGRTKVHIHLICDPQQSGFNPLQSSNYLVDLLVVEALPAFYSHPCFSGLSLYRSRPDFHAAFAKIARDDSLSQSVYQENESHFAIRTNFDRTVQYFRKVCSFHDDINAYYEQTGAIPKVGFLEDCLIDWRALQSQYPKETFWVTVQFRFRKMDTGMPVPEEGLRRDAPFLSWFNFLAEAGKQYPFARFVLLGRLQEKPLEVLRLPNVVVLRTLGMNLGHEITAVINSDLYMGSPSGFAQAAHFSDVPYDIFNCTEDGCKNYGIPFGTERLPNAHARQRLRYGVEDCDTLLESLKQALQESGAKPALPETYEINLKGSTDRFFINDDQSEAELSRILSTRLISIGLAIERGEFQAAQNDLRKLGESFPRFVPQWQDFHMFSAALEVLTRGADAPAPTDEQVRERNEHLAKVAGYCHPSRLIRRNGRYFNSLPGTEGMSRDGWCESKAKLVFAPTDRGDYLIMQIAGLSSSEPTRLTVQINQQPAMPFVLVNEDAVLEIPVLELSIPTVVTLLSDRARKVHSRDETKYAYLIDGAGLCSHPAPTLTRYRGDKRDSREKVLSGTYSNGLASSLMRVRIDNPLPDDVEIMIHLDAQLPRPVRKGQFCRIQINDGEAHQAVVSGKHFEAFIPCPGRPRRLAISLQFWNRDGSETEARENRAMIRGIDILPATVKKADFRSGYRGALVYLYKNLKAKLNKRRS